MDTTVLIRQANPGDAEGVGELLTELGYPIEADEAATRLARGTETVLVADADGRLVGLLAVWSQLPIARARPVARVTAMVVRAEMRGRGIGASLMQHAMRWARDAGCEGIELTSGIRAERELAHNFYEGVGFVRTSYRFWLPLIELGNRATARLRLRRIAVDDLPALIAIHADPATNTYRPGGPPTLEWSRQFLEALIQEWVEHGIGYWSLEFEGEVIGVAGVEPLEFRGRSCWNLYYRLTPTAWGKGLASEAAREAIEVGAMVRPSWPVVARTRPGNLPSARVAQNAGLDRRPDLDVDGYIVFARGW